MMTKRFQIPTKVRVLLFVGFTTHISGHRKVAIGRHAPAGPRHGNVSG